MSTAESPQFIARTNTYQLAADEVDIPAIVDRVQAGLPILRRRAVAAGFRSGIWGEEYPSLKSFPSFRRMYRGFSPRGQERVDMFEAKTGAINVPSDQVATSPLGEFFTPLRTRDRKGFTELRGLTYYVALDFSKNTPDKKLAVMKSDVQEGLAITASIDRRNLSAMEFLLYLGILDHLKSHTLTAFHALTFHERTGIIPDDANYTSARKEAQRMMVLTTKAYYQACLGQPFDAGFDSSNIRNALERTADYIASSGHSEAHFTYLEVDHPAVIMLGAHEAARKKSRPDLIIGIPSGGTEVAVVTRLMYESLYPNISPPDIAFVPLSFHFRGQGGIDRDQLAEILKRSTSVAGRRVLIVDDNSNTGSTVQRMAEAVIKAGAADISVHIAEIDPAKVRVKHKRENGLPYGVVNMDHPDLQTAMGIAWTSDQDGDDLRRKEIKRYVKSVHYKVEKKDS